MARKMHAIEWIEKLKQANGWQSDYRVAKELGVSVQALSSIRTGQTKLLSDETALKVAELMGIEPMKVLTDQAIERAKSPAVKKAWRAAQYILCLISASDVGVISIRKIRQKALDSVRKYQKAA